MRTHVKRSTSSSQVGAQPLGPLDGSGLPLNDNLALSPGPFAPLKLCHFDWIDLLSYLGKLWIFYAGLSTPRLSVFLSAVRDSPSPIDAKLVLNYVWYPCARNIL